MIEELKLNVFPIAKTFDDLQKYAKEEPNTLIQEKGDYFELISEEWTLYFFIENNEVIFIWSNLINPYLIKEICIVSKNAYINSKKFLFNKKWEVECDNNGDLIVSNFGELSPEFNRYIIHVYSGNDFTRLWKWFVNKEWKNILFKSDWKYILEDDKVIVEEESNYITVYSDYWRKEKKWRVTFCTETWELLKDWEKFIYLDKNRWIDTFISYNNDFTLNWAWIFKDWQYIYLTREFEEYIENNKYLKISINENNITIWGIKLDINLENWTFLKDDEWNYVISSWYLFFSYKMKENSQKNENPLEKVWNWILKENEETKEKEYLYITWKDWEKINWKINYNEKYIELNNEYKTKVSFNNETWELLTLDNWNYTYIVNNSYFFEYDEYYNITNYWIYKNQTYIKSPNIWDIQIWISNVKIDINNGNLLELVLENNLRLSLSINEKVEFITDNEWNFIYKLDDTFKSYDENLEEVWSWFINEQWEHIYITWKDWDKIKNVKKIDIKNETFEIQKPALTLSFNKKTWEILTDEKWRYILDFEDWTFESYKNNTFAFFSSWIVNKETWKYEYIKIRCTSVKNHTYIAEKVTEIDTKNNTFNWNRNYNPETLICIDISEWEYEFDNNLYKFDGENWYFIIWKKEILITDKSIISEIKVHIRQEEWKTSLEKIIPEY